MENNVNTNGMVEVGFSLSCNIDEAYKEIQSTAVRLNTPTYGKFNGKILLSTDTLDEMYKKVTGMTKGEMEESKRKWLEEHERKEAEFKAKIPQLTEEYREKARGVILESKLEEWDRIVPIRLDDLYHGMELDQTLDISRIMGDENMNYDTRLRDAYKCFMDAKHSGISAHLVASMLRAFCPHGEDIADAVMKFRFEEKAK